MQMSLLWAPLVSVLLLGRRATAQGIPGYLPVGYPTSDPPAPDLRPNDVYQHIEAAQRPEVRRGDVVLYPAVAGFDLGQDGEQHIYEVVNLFDLQQQQHQQQLQEQGQYQPFSSPVSNVIGGPSTVDGDAYV